MKKLLTTICIISMLFIMTACGQFSVTENTGKLMTIEAKNITKGESMEFGSLEIQQGEQIMIISELKEGEINLEFIKEPENQSADKLPDLDVKPAVEIKANGNNAYFIDAMPGSYYIKTKVETKATGNITIEAKKGA